MKLSLNQLRLNTQEFGWSEDLTDIKQSELEYKIGSQLGAIDEVIKTGQLYDGLVIVTVVEVKDHPNADRLHVCLVDDHKKVQGVERNSDGLVQVVCGAPNVRAGMRAVWLPPGSTVPESRSHAEPFVLEARELRGVVSNGMLASEKELGLSDNHDGILELEQDYQAGSDFSESLSLGNDTVIDIENKMFTHRPDCFGIMGLARELAGIEGKSFKSPDWYMTEPGEMEETAADLDFSVDNQLTDLVPRFSAVAIKDITVGPSPSWLKAALHRQGLRSINNIVDLTNYYMVLTGQPLHAYDYDKVKDLSSSGVKIVIRHPLQKEKIELLNGKTVEPPVNSIMIATDTAAIGLGGVMGGASTEVDESTRNVILESANFNMYTIRRTSMALGIFSDAVTRFTKGQSPLQTKRVLKRISEDVIKTAGGQLASAVKDDNHVAPEAIARQSLYPEVSINAQFINERLGLNLNNDDIIKCLERVEFQVKLDNDMLVITAPFWRTDIEIREDIVEEVGRLIGYDTIEQRLPRRQIIPATKNHLLETKGWIRHQLSNFGANEVLSYSFVNGKLLDAVEQDRNQAFVLANALRPELEYYRLSLLPSLLEKVQPNLKAGYRVFGLYEIGKAHNLTSLDEHNLPSEQELTSFVIASNQPQQQHLSAYYQAKHYLELLFKDELIYEPIGPGPSSLDSSLYEPARSALVRLKSGEEVAVIGEFKTRVKNKLKLPDYCAGFEVLTEQIDRQPSTKGYEVLSRYPAVIQDLTLKSDSDLAYDKIFSELQHVLRENMPEDVEAKLIFHDIYQSDEDKSHKNTTFRIAFESQNRTLTDKLTNEVLARAISQLKPDLNLVQI